MAELKNHLRQLGSESVIYGLSGVISRFVSFFLVPIYTRIFSPEDYGVMTLVTSTISVVAIFVSLGLDSAAHRWYWETEDLTERKRSLASWAWCQITLSLVFALAMALAAKWLAETIIGRDDAVLYFQLSSWTLPLGVLTIVTTNWLRMQRRPWATMVYSISTTMLNILLTIVFVIVMRKGLAGVYVAQLISTGISMIIAGYLMKDWLSPRYFNRQRLSDMLRFGMPLIPSGLAYWIVSLSDRYFIQFFTTTTEVGLYAIGSAIAGAVALGNAAFQTAWVPFALSIHKRSDAKQVYSWVFLAYVWVMCVICALVGVLAPEAIRIVATEAYSGASSVVAALAFSIALTGVANIAAIGPAIVKNMNPSAIGITAAAVVNIALNFVLVPKLGKEGAALATLFSQGIIPFYLFYRAQQMYPIPYRFGPAVSLVVLAWILIWIGSSWQFDNLWVGVVAKLALVSLFIPALFLLKIVTPTQALRLFRPATADVA
jgi:O-antigen/teichoic acid export membrane protein